MLRQVASSEFAIVVGRNDDLPLIMPQMPHRRSTGSVLTIIGVRMTNDFVSSFDEENEPLHGNIYYTQQTFESRIPYSASDDLAEVQPRIRHVTDTEMDKLGYTFGKYPSDFSDLRIASMKAALSEITHPHTQNPKPITCLGETAIKEFEEMLQAKFVPDYIHRQYATFIMHATTELRARMRGHSIARQPR